MAEIRVPLPTNEQVDAIKTKIETKITSELSIRSVVMSSGQNYNSALVDAYSNDIQYVGLKVRCDQITEVWLQVSDDQTTFTNLYAVYLPPSHSTGSNQADIVTIPMTYINAKYYRWRIWNRGTATQTYVNIVEQRSSSVVNDQNLMVALFSRGLEIRNTTPTGSWWAVINGLGGKTPKNIFIENSHDQDVTVEISIARTPLFSIALPKYTITSGSEMSITYADIQELAGPISTILLTYTFSVAPTSGSITAGIIGCL